MDTSILASRYYTKSDIIMLQTLLSRSKVPFSHMVVVYGTSPDELIQKDILRLILYKAYYI